ncbi:MAG: ComF family protein [Sulfurifustis sp.]
MQVYERLKRVGGWFLAVPCPLCAASIAPELDLCAGCERSLPKLSAACARCAAPFESVAAAGSICGLCQQEPPTYTTVHAAFRYAAPVDRLIQGAKYGERLDYAALLGRRLASHVGASAAAVDVIVPVPLHRSRLRQRGYNQSMEIARPVASALGVPLVSLAERARVTPPQTALSREERQKNVRNAFRTTGDVAAKRVAVVDDVMTSGATAEMLARCLLKAGASDVEIWVVARA